MLKIRMQRIGRRNDPAFRLVVTEHTAGPKAGTFIEKVGSYNPKTKARALAEDRIRYWLSVGAQSSGVVHNMLVSAGIVDGKKVNVLPKKHPPKKEAEEQAPEETPAEEGAEVSKAEEPKGEKETAAAPEEAAPAEAETPDSSEPESAAAEPKEEKSDQ